MGVLLAAALENKDETATADDADREVTVDAEAVLPLC
jgi:hypothetical protein